MTAPARAAVDAWMREECPHSISIPRTRKRDCPDCLLAYAAAQVKEENWACEQIVLGYLGTRGLADLIRARREGPGGET